MALVSIHHFLVFCPSFWQIIVKFSYLIALIADLFYLNMILTDTAIMQYQKINSNLLFHRIQSISYNEQ